MQMNERIVYSTDQIMISIENTLKQLDTFRYDSQYRDLLGASFIDKLTKWEDIIRKRRNEPFTLTVIGDFKRGKSTFINAFLGEEIVTTAVTPETVTLNKIGYGASDNQAVLSGTKRFRLANDELKRERLEEVLNQTGETVKKLELMRPNDKLKELTIIDTPGMNDALKDFEGMVKDSIMEADAIIYLYNVMYPLSLTEQIFLKSTVAPQKYTKLFIVGNFADMLDNEKNYKKMRDLLGDRVHHLFPDADIYMISALDELCRQLDSEGEERPCEKMIPILEDQFDRLRLSITQLLEEKKENVVTDRVLRLTTTMIEDLLKEIDMIESGLQMSSDDAANIIKQVKWEKESSIQKQEELRTEMKLMISDMKDEACGWMAEFLERIENEIPNLRSESSQTLCKYYEFYCMDLLQEALDTCIDYHREKIYEKLESVSTELLKNMVNAFDKKKKYTMTVNVDNKMWTKGDNVGLAANLISNFGTIGAIAGLVGTAVAGVMRQPELKKRSVEFVDQISGKITGMNRQVMTTVEAVYKDMSEKAEKMVTEFYADELAETERIAEQTAAVAYAEEEKKKEIRKSVERAKQILLECMNNIQ
ncbi:MAG: dynamin family protein [Clostridia bacterium]|nr:dynamin family protein [Clostridia bacterium]